jgi:hypothetical protein
MILAPYLIDTGDLANLALLHLPARNDSKRAQQGKI